MWKEFPALKSYRVSPCINIASIPSPDASHSKTNGCVKSGNASMGQLLITSLSLSKARCAVSDELNAPFFVKSIRGAKSYEKPLMNFL